MANESASRPRCFGRQAAAANASDADQPLHSMVAAAGGGRVLDGLLHYIGKRAFGRPEARRDWNEIVPSPEARHGGAVSAVEVVRLWLTVLEAEGDRIWSRFNAMLVANSVVGVLLGALGARAASGWIEFLLVGLAAAVGLRLCRLWWLINARGWERYDFYHRQGRQVVLPGATNPLEIYFEWRESVDARRLGSTRAAAKAVIRVFALAYLAVIAVALIGVWRSLVLN